MHCSYKTSTIRHLKEHKKSVHDRVQYPFKHCSYKPITKGSLAKHYKEVHKGLKYHCKYCIYKATWKGSIKENQKSVYEGNKYPCKHWSFEATQKRHLRTTHCDHQGKSAYQNQPTTWRKLTYSTDNNHDLQDEYVSWNYLILKIFICNFVHM